MEPDTVNVFLLLPDPLLPLKSGEPLLMATRVTPPLLVNTLLAITGDAEPLEKDMAVEPFPDNKLPLIAIEQLLHPQPPG